jgi:MerR family mercuric resistance operon transcriptional regulator
VFRSPRVNVYGASNHWPAGQAGAREPRNGSILRAPPTVTASAAIYCGLPSISDDALKRLRFIRHAKVLGFSLEEIRKLLALRINSVDRCDRVRERTQAKIADVDRKIEALQQMRGVLSELVTACSQRRKTEACPILDSMEATGDPT